MPMVHSPMVGRKSRGLAILLWYEIVVEHVHLCPRVSIHCGEPENVFAYTVSVVRNMRPRALQSISTLLMPCTAVAPRSAPPNYEAASYNCSLFPGYLNWLLT